MTLHVAHDTAAKDAEIEALRAEVEFARETLRSSLDADIDAGEPLRTLAARANNALYWRDQCRQEAEAHAKRLAEALREIAEFDGAPSTPVRNSVKKSAIARAALHPTAAQENDDA